MRLTHEQAVRLLGEIEAELTIPTPALEVAGSPAPNSKTALEVAQDERRQFRLRKLRLAQQRLNTGEYGYCQSCGEDIDQERLFADPLTPICRCCSQNRVN